MHVSLFSHGLETAVAESQPGSLVLVAYVAIYLQNLYVFLELSIFKVNPGHQIAQKPQSGFRNGWGILNVAVTGH